MKGKHVSLAVICDRCETEEASFECARCNTAADPIHLCCACLEKVHRGRMARLHQCALKQLHQAMVEDVQEEANFPSPPDSPTGYPGSYAFPKSEQTRHKKTSATLNSDIHPKPNNVSPHTSKMHNRMQSKIKSSRDGLTVAKELADEMLAMTLALLEKVGSENTLQDAILNRL